MCIAARPTTERPRVQGTTDVHARRALRAAKKNTTTTIQVAALAIRSWIVACQIIVSNVGSEASSTATTASAAKAGSPRTRPAANSPRAATTTGANTNSFRHPTLDPHACPDAIAQASDSVRVW